MTNVQFQITNAEGQPLTSLIGSPTEEQRVELYPQTYPFNNNGTIVDADILTFIPDVNGQFTCSLTPMVYKGNIMGDSSPTPFYINVPNSSSAVNAADCIVIPTCSLNPATVAYSVQQSNALFLPMNGTASYATTAAYASNAGSAPSYVSGLYAFGQSGSVDYIEVSHSLENTPSYANLVVVCVSDDATSNIKAGDEVPANQWMDTIDSAPAFSFGANHSTLWATTALTGADYPDGIAVVTKISGGAGAISSVSNFKLKFYARL